MMVVVDASSINNTTHEQKADRATDVVTDIPLQNTYELNEATDILLHNTNNHIEQEMEDNQKENDEKKTDDVLLETCAI
jgi:hypothetical protein